MKTKTKRNEKQNIDEFSKTQIVHTYYDLQIFSNDLQNFIERKCSYSLVV